MKLILRNILAVIVGCIFGGAFNMAIIMVSGYIIPPPAGANITTMEGLTASMHLFTPINFLMPFLAHALGSLLGAYTAALIAVNHKLIFGLTIGVCFLVGGIMNILMLPSPLWFTIVDLIVAYIPMGYLGAKWAIKK
ncbi:MAG: hypothetical protein K9G64_02060 [Bacteroidia bacterium]|nr:hypothetical protein [Bacteroidia bacterium]